MGLMVAGETCVEPMQSFLERRLRLMKIPESTGEDRQLLEYRGPYN